MRAYKSIHPLLLDPSYWRNRLQDLGLEKNGMTAHHRPDLSGHGREVVEFHMETPDGANIWGLFARPSWVQGPRPARIRSVGPAELPSLDPGAVEDGIAELVYQGPAGRRLEDRVLDTLRVCSIATRSEGVDSDHILFETKSECCTPADEVLIAERLLDGRFDKS
ncbi:MAG: hypothetical protein ACI8QC_002028 [Planctomycetota bacterium]|jgi:hypothetical protein